MRTGYDSVASTAAEWRSIVPETKPEVIGSYWNGIYANTTVAREAFPHARHVQYDVNASEPRADILDIESGDAVPSQAPGWSREYKGTLDHPGLYTSASNVMAVVTAMLDAGFKRDEFLVQSAHYTYEAHICGPRTCGEPQADATQYADHGHRGQNTDLSLFSDHFFGAVKPPKPDMHYRYFDSKRRAILLGRSERGLAETYDKLRARQTSKKHPQRAHLLWLQGMLRIAAKRVAGAAEEAHPHLSVKKALAQTTPAEHYGWRHVQLSGRASGHRFI